MSQAILQENGTYRFDAAIADSTIDNAETAHTNFEPIRRAALLVLERSYEQLAQPLRDSNEAGSALLNLYAEIDKYLKWRQSETELLESAHARLLLVLSQEAEGIESAESDVQATEMSS
ncbi:hypothetical protein [Thiorhodococcus minor]|uniref:Uncharacterized protein n=1 Tax=Thiorhodococcus minor TaxID=57489 RepID=A0A6M0K6A2_9GAMM|nr:hypothetical protein [Thiorhodococcus minor]NEV64127.1 hypothetical protein [Thiorhodococcus minor]